MWTRLRSTPRYLARRRESDRDLTEEFDAGAAAPLFVETALAFFGGAFQEGPTA